MQNQGEFESSFPGLSMTQDIVISVGKGRSEIYVVFFTPIRIVNDQEFLNRLLDHLDEFD